VSATRNAPPTGAVFLRIGKEKSKPSLKPQMLKTVCIAASPNFINFGLLICSTFLDFQRNSL
jgi:hypothetical protein